MSRYSYFPAYVPVAQRRANGLKQLEKLKKKGTAIEPLEALTHRTKIATSFWGSAWCKHLESFSDFSNRLPRGRTYVRNGSVLHLAITPGEVNAMVQGSSLYQETITITPLPEKKWRAIQQRCQGKIGSLIELLQGKISNEIMAIVTDPKDGLFPSPSEIKLDCSCPDWATMCKHIAAVLYGVGARLDNHPELLFKLRGVDHNDLISVDAPGIDLGASGKTGGRRRTLDASALGDVFGIDLDTAAEPAAVPIKTKKAAKKAAKKTTKKIAKKVTKKTPKKSRPFKPSSASILKLRKQLALTRAGFAKQVGVSTQSIILWEEKGGPLNVRAASLARLQALAIEAAK